MSADRHACPDCGASHRKKAPQKTTRTNLTAYTDIAPSKCPHCAGSTLVGRVQGLDLTLDPRPINALGAQTYRALGRTMITLRGLRARLHDGWTHWPPDDGTQWHTTHRCGMPVPHELGDATIDRTRRTFTPLPDTPPY